MTVATLQRLVLSIANCAHVRVWYHWNAPQEDPWLMAISVIWWDGIPLEQDYLEDEYQMIRDVCWEKNGVWTVERTNVDGSPFRLVL